MSRLNNSQCAIANRDLPQSSEADSSKSLFPSSNYAKTGPKSLSSLKEYFRIYSNFQAFKAGLNYSSAVSIFSKRGPVFVQSYSCRFFKECVPGVRGLILSSVNLSFVSLPLPPPPLGSISFVCFIVATVAAKVQTFLKELSQTFFWKTFKVEKANIIGLCSAEVGGVHPDVWGLVVK